MKKHIDFVDLAKGICIILVVFSHVDPFNEFAKHGSSFRLPLYYALGGLFFKTYSNVFEFIFKKINSLIIPFLFFNLLLWLFNIYFYNNRIKPLSLFLFFHEDKVRNNPPIWFLISLFEVNILFYLLYILTRGKDIFLLVFSLIIGGLGFYFAKMRIELTTFLDTSLTVFPFFILGYFINKHTPLLKEKTWDRYIWWLLIPLLLIVLFFAQPNDLRVNKILNNAFLFYLVGISGFLFVFLLSKKINTLPFISYIGKYSIIILSVHWFFLKIIQTELKPIVPEKYSYNFIYFLMVLFASFFCIPIFIKIFPWFTAQKELIPTKWMQKKTTKRPFLTRMFCFKNKK